MIDTEALKRAHPIETVVARYGIDLHPSGRALVGRCPLHDDRGRPNLYVYPDQDSWFCYRCNVGGDVISLVERVERVGFREAAVRLEGRTPIAPATSAGRVPHAAPVSQSIHRERRGGRSVPPPQGPDERACLAAAVELYHNRLLGDEVALAYAASRGLDRETLVRCRVGYAAGDELASYLRWRGIPAKAGLHTGLLRHDGRELMVGRIVVPEIRAGQVLWMVGRTIPPAETDGEPSQPAQAGTSSSPKYLGLPGVKPLLGWEDAVKSPAVCLTEGVFDYLTLSCWGFPTLALVGTRVRPGVVQELARFRRVYVLLDSDEAGQSATKVLLQELAEVGTHGVRIALPRGVKDVAELGVLPDGQDRFAALVLRAARTAGVPGIPDLAAVPRRPADLAGKRGLKPAA